MTMTHAEAQESKRRSNRASKARIAAENLPKLRAYLREHPCTDCGEWDIVVLEFDHLRDKTANVSRLVRSAPWERVAEEIAKCEVVCANCHRRRTARRAGYHSWGVEEFEELACP